MELNDKGFANVVMDNFMSLYFAPEVIKRKELGLLSEEFILTAAQAIFFPDGGETIIRLNEEVVANIKIKKGVIINHGDFPSINEVENIVLNEEEYLNCGHATLVLLKNGYQLTFDFQYNKLNARKNLKSANEFLRTSKYAINNLYVSAFIDNAFSAIELIAKAHLLISSVLKNSDANHKAIKSSFNQILKHSTLDFESNQREVFNRLSDERRNARYLDGDVNIDISELSSIYKTIEQMHEDLIARIN